MPLPSVDSLLKQAYDLKAQGKRDEARVLFEKLMREYPNTSAGVEARWIVAYYRLHSKQFDETRRVNSVTNCWSKPRRACRHL